MRIINLSSREQILSREELKQYRKDVKKLNCIDDNRKKWKRTLKRVKLFRAKYGMGWAGELS